MATSIPPHNAAELIDAAVHLIDHPDAPTVDLLQYVQGPDFPTGGIVADGPAAIREAYETGRGAFRTRARFADPERLAGGTWQLIITEIPYGVPKAKLIEQIAGLITEKKLPILADVRDESDEAIRIVIEPRSRTVDVETLKDSLYRLTDLEVRVSLNLNVLDATRTPRVMSLAQALSAYLAHQIEVLVNRSKHRLAKIEARIELLDGFLIAYLNLDRVIAIIRTEDEPKPVMMAEFGLTDTQVEAILNMRLRSLRRLEEMEIKKERSNLDEERKGLAALIESPQRQRTRLKKDLAKLRERYAPETAIGARRTTVAEAGPAREIPLEAMIEREPITVILSRRGWVRAMSGHRDLAAADTLKFKEGDGPLFAFHAQTTDRLLLAAANGRVFTLAADKLPGGRGFGEPVRLMVDLEGEGAPVALLPVPRSAGDAQVLVASSDGRGFLAKLGEVVAETRKGKQVMNLRPGAEMRIFRPVAAGSDYVAVVGDNRKMVVFPVGELPEMARGSGVQLQRYRDGGLSDAMAIRFESGISWAMGGESGRTRTEGDLNPWRTARGAGGRMAPLGFPRDNRFGPAPNGEGPESKN
jgi:topoisomerase-4 subunit A